MSPTPATLNPSQTVERIREIIVGRHLERLEGRVSRLEATPRAAEATPDSGAARLEDRILVNEARVEALQDHVHRLGGDHWEMGKTAAMYRQEAQRLTAQIQEIARERAAAAAPAENGNLERKLGAWLADWQVSMDRRLDSRDRNLVEWMRTELSAIKQGVESRISELESIAPLNVEERFNRIAAAARALAESAGSFSKPIPRQE